MNKYISNYTVPEQKYKPFDKLYLISIDPEINDIKEVIIYGINYGIYEDGNKLRYEIVEFPVPVACPIRITDIIDSLDINSGNAVFINSKNYFVSDSKETLLKIKYNYILFKIDELEIIKKELSKQ